MIRWQAGQEVITPWDILDTIDAGEDSYEDMRDEERGEEYEEEWKASTVDCGSWRAGTAGQNWPLHWLKEGLTGLSGPQACQVGSSTLMGT